MNKTLVLFVQQKNIDLHAMSARESILADLGIKKVTKLQRFDKWTVTFENNNGQDDANKQLEKLLSQSFFMVNPNKETYTLNSPPPRSAAQREQGFRTTVSQKISQHFDLDKINKNCGVNIVSLEHALVWDIYVNKQADQTPQQLQEQVTAEVIVTSGHSKGLLVNPISETYAIEPICV